MRWAAIIDSVSAGKDIQFSLVSDQLCQSYNYAYPQDSGYRLPRFCKHKLIDYVCKITRDALLKPSSPVVGVQHLYSLPRGI